MQQSAQQYVELFKKYIHGTLNEKEKKALAHLLSQSEDYQTLFRQLTDGNHLISEIRKLQQTDPKEEWQKLVVHLR